MTKYFLQRLGVVSLEDDDGTCSAEGEAFFEGFVEGGIPPEFGVEIVKGPAEAVGGDSSGGVGGEDGDLLVGETGKVKGKR